MKNLILGFALVGLTFACKSNDTMNVDDASAPNMPAAECGEGGCEGMKECSGDMKSECSDMKAECSDMKAECSDMKAECSSTKTECSDMPAECSDAGAVCPVTGTKPIN